MVAEPELAPTSNLSETPPAWQKRFVLGVRRAHLGPAAGGWRRRRVRRARGRCLVGVGRVVAARVKDRRHRPAAAFETRATDLSDAWLEDRLWRGRGGSVYFTSGCLRALAVSSHVLSRTTQSLRNTLNRGCGGGCLRTCEASAADLGAGRGALRVCGLLDIDDASRGRDGVAEVTGGGRPARGVSGRTACRRGGGRSEHQRQRRHRFAWGARWTAGWRGPGEDRRGCRQ